MATSRPWNFVENPFLNVTKANYKLSVRISTYHYAQLQTKKGDAFFDLLIKTYAPKHEALIRAFKKWKAQGGRQLGNTKNLKDLLKMLRSLKAKQWDVAIQQVYENTTAEYKMLLPNNRKPFQQGSQNDRIEAVNTLTEAIGDDAKLQDVLEDVNNFYAQLSDAFISQKGSKGGKKNTGTAVEEARVEMCIAQYANLGLLMGQYARTPGVAGQFYDQEAIRTGAQVLFTGSIKPEENKVIVKRKLTATDKLLLRNEGKKALVFYVAAQRNSVPGEVTIIVPAGKELLVTAAQLGATASNTCLNVWNPDTLSAGEWTVKFV